MPAPTISPLPSPPSRSDDPTNFANKADALLGSLPDFVTQANAQADYLDDLAAAVDADAATALNAAEAATGAANYRGDYNAGTTYQIGQSVSYSGGVFVAKTVNTGVTPVDGANWLQILNGDVTLTGVQTLTNKTLAAPVINSARSAVVTVAASAIDCSAGSYFIKTASGALTWTITNVPASGAFTFILELTNGGTGTQTWPAAVKWPGGTAPTLTASGVDVLGFITDDGGTTWRGVAMMTDSK